MIKIYLASVLIWLTILKFTESFSKEMIKNRTDIDYKKYIEGKSLEGKLKFSVISFIPIVRLFVWGVIIFLTFARQEDLDKFFEKKEK